MTCGNTFKTTRFPTTRCTIRGIAPSVAGPALTKPEMVITSAAAVGRDLTRWNAAFTPSCPRRLIFRFKKRHGLSVKTRKPEHLHFARGVQQVRKPRHALEHRQGLHRAALAGAQGVLRARPLPARSRGHDLQNPVHDRIPRPPGEGLEAGTSRGQKRG